MPPQVLRTMSSRPEGFRRDEIKDLSLVVEYLDWVDLALENGEFPKWRAAIVVTYWLSRVGKHPKSTPTQLRYSAATVTLDLNSF